MSDRAPSPSSAPPTESFTDDEIRARFAHREMTDADISAVREFVAVCARAAASPPSPALAPTTLEEETRRENDLMNDGPPRARSTPRRVGRPQCPVVMPGTTAQCRRDAGHDGRHGPFAHREDDPILPPIVGELVAAAVRYGEAPSGSAEENAACDELARRENALLTALRSSASALRAAYLSGYFDGHALHVYEPDLGHEDVCGAAKHAADKYVAIDTVRAALAPGHPEVDNG